MNALTNSSISNGFDTVFSEVDSTKKLNLKNNNCLRLFYLDMFNNEFTYTGLHQLLQRNIGRYVFSRASIEQFKAEGDAEAIGLKAIELLRKANNPNDNGAGGELGEILLYLFLENKLNAPKLLSKVELKTTGNQYVFGSDSVHLFQLDNKNFQLILGESKIKGVLSKAVDEAFESIEKVSNNPDNELRLIEKNILSESFDEATTEFIKSLIVPLKRDKTISVDNAFGIFLGYAVILYQWISGNGLSLIMQSAIKYKKDHPSSGVEVDRKIVEYDDSIKHRNIVISDTLNAIEDVILFRIANYFLRFSSEYKRFHNIDVLPNDWYEYVEYGTTNPLTIFLQRNGFSREASTYIKQHLEYITEVNGEYKVKTELLDCPSKSVCKEAAEIKYNIPELFIEA